MSTKDSNLRMLPVNKTVVFKSPIENTEDVLCRTGTIAEGSCFFHSLLQAMSKEYQGMDVKGKMKFVSKLRNKISSKIDPEKWENINGGIVSKISYQENVLKYFTDVYRYFSNNKIKYRETKELLKLILTNYTKEDNQFITELIPLEKLESRLLPKSYAESENEKIEDCNEVVIKHCVNYLLELTEIKKVDDSKSDFLTRILIDMYLNILNFCKEKSFSDYVKSLKNTGEDIDTFSLSMISEKFNRDIYFINGDTRLPYNNASTVENLKGRKSIIILWVGQNHYEIVGRLLPNNVVQREFKADDKLIKKMYTFLIHPDQIPSLYPELKVFIPKEYRPALSPNPYNFTFCNSSDEQEDSDNISSNESDDDYEYTGYHRSSSGRKRNRIKSNIPQNFSTLPASSFY